MIRYINKLTLLPLLLLITLTTSSHAVVYQVGNGQTYASPNALYQANVIQAGDTIEIDAGTYTGQEALAVWDQNDLLIRGVGGRPKLDADGLNIWGKGIWVFAGNDIIVENIEFTGATVVDENGAGIRLDGIGMTARNCYFHHNENGILTSNPYDGDILIEHCEFGYNGFGDGFTHNLYIGHVNQLIFRYNYSHHANVGHNLKSRAVENIIQYNRIMDESTGNSSRLIDLSNGGFALVQGNLFMQGPQAENNNVIGYGREGLSNNPPHEIYCVNNSLVNKRAASCIFFDIQPGTITSVLANNIIAGTGDVSRGPISLNQNNLIESNISAVGFVDELNYNYQLIATSSAIDQGAQLPSVNNYNLVPNRQYEHPVQYTDRIIQDSVDIGAYEYENQTGIPHITTTSVAINIYPNPYTDKVVLEGLFQSYEIQVLNDSGQVVYDYTGATSPLTIQLNTLSAGLYFIYIQSTSSPDLSVQKIIKM